MTSIKLGFLGAGNMAGAMIKGILAGGYLSRKNIHVFDIAEEKCHHFQELGLIVESDAIRLTESCDVIFLAVKPQNIEELLLSIHTSGIPIGVKVFASIAAGVSTDYIRRLLSARVPVVRAMPNTPLLLAEGATALCRTENVADDVFEFIKGIFSVCGTVYEIEEAFMNAVISVNGSSPAYIYLLAKIVVDYATSQGIPSEIALSLFCQTLKGSASMLLHSGYSPEELIRMVSSPGGTTLAALDVFEKRDFSSIVTDAMDACTRRAEELGK